MILLTYLNSNSKLINFLFGSSIGAITFTITYRIFVRLYRKYKKLPPGPVGLPILGNLLDVYRSQLIFLEYLGMNYYPISSYFGLGRTIIMINDSELAKQILSSNLDRPAVPTSALLHESFGEINNESWKHRRKIAMSSLISIIQKEYLTTIAHNAFNEYIFPLLNNWANNHNLWYPRKDCQYLAVNTIFNAALGETLPKDEIDEHTEICAKSINELRRLRIGIRFPKPIRWLLNINIEEILETFKKRDLVYERIIDKRKNLYYDSNNLERYIDFILKEYENGTVTKEEMIKDVALLFDAGTDTTATATEIGIILAAKNPEIQERVAKQLREVFKCNNNEFKLFTFDKLDQLPLLEAYVHEIIRYASATQGVPHCISNQDLKLNHKNIDYILPKGSLIFSNLYYIHTLSNYEKWKCNSKLCLENFLDNNNKFIKNESFIGFGHGKRDCVGKQVAIKELYLFIGTLFMNYKFIKSIDSDDKLHLKGGLVPVVSPEEGVYVQTR